jgi:phage portal protein BeeE
MGIVKDLINASRDYFKSDEEAKAYTMLDLKSAVPMHNAGRNSTGYVQTYSGWADWDNAINQRLGWQTGTRINYANEIGSLKLSVLLMAAVRFAGINLAQGRMQVVELDADEKENPILDHPFTELFKNPNPDTSQKNLWKQFAMSWVLTGEAYFLLGRDGAGRVKEIWFEPQETIRPKWDRVAFPEDPTANEFIQYFDIWRDGQWQPWRKMDTLAIYDQLDPDTRHGWNGVQSLFRTIFTDQEREQYTALLLKNFGVTPKAVAPKTDNVAITPEDAAKLSSDLQRRWSGDDRGKPMSFTHPMEVLDFGTNFAADAMEKIAHISESRVAAAIGISAQSLRYMVAMRSSSYNNIREFRREDFEQWIMPTQDDFVEAAQKKILRDMDSNPRHVLRMDYSTVPIVQRDRMEVAKETEILVRNRVIDQAEARERHAYEFEPKGDEGKYRDVWFPVQAATLTLSPIGGEEKPDTDETDDDSDEPTKAAKGDRIPKGVLDKSADFWREHSALDEAQRSLIDATEYKAS